MGAGPAGLACAHTLARLGHDVVMFDAKPKAGGLNEYGLASYKTPDNFAQAEVQWLLDIGGIELRTQLEAGNARRSSMHCARTLMPCSWAWAWPARTSLACPAKT